MVCTILGCELYLKNRCCDGDVVKSVFPVKKVFVAVTDVDVAVEFDSMTLEHYGENVEKASFSPLQTSLAMPSNNLVSVGLPYRGTGANSKKPYVEFFGRYDKTRLSLSIAGRSGGQKVSYEYKYDFGSGKEDVGASVDFLLLRLDDKCYFVGEKLLFDAYREAGVVTPEGALSSEVFLTVCKTFSAFWKERVTFEELKKPFVFRLIVLPLSLVSQNKVEYRSQEKTSGEDEFEDCFGNSATDYPSTPTITAKFLSFDDEAFTINCKTKKEFYKNLGIGNESFEKIALPSDSVVNISGLEWYFFTLDGSSLDADKGVAGIYDKLLSNYMSLSPSSQSGLTAQKSASLKILCTKRAQAKLEVLMDENLTLDQMKEMFSRTKDGFKKHPMALESLIIKTARDIIWTDYITAIRYFMYGAYFDRVFLVQRFSRVLREELRIWLKNVKLAKTNTDSFFERSMFCLKLLTKTESGLIMDKNEEYAYKIGVIAGKYVKFKRDKNEANNSTKDILIYSKYDRERLRFVYQRVGIGVSLSKVNTDDMNKFIKDNVPTEEIDDSQAHNDYSYFFYKGVFENLV
ncbi:MAG: hypothetical protein FWC41_12715 [Firmicutes bacterium]|nr:hypothetical protein [Bacillota bacterium]